MDSYIVSWKQFFSNILLLRNILENFWKLIILAYSWYQLNNYWIFTDIWKINDYPSRKAKQILLYFLMHF